MAFNVLIVDDSRTVRTVVEKTLRMAGIPLGDVHQAANGQEALDLLAKHWIDLVLADINMPVMSGAEMIQKMSEQGLTKSVPVIIVSTEGSTTRIDDLKGKGVADYIRKPFVPEVFGATIRKVLNIAA
jgi:two-component system chemotaxis response regulator CheY